MSSEAPAVEYRRAREWLGVHRTTIVRAIERGYLVALMVGTRGRYRVPLEAVEEWLRPAHDPEETT